MHRRMLVCCGAVGLSGCGFVPTLLRDAVGCYSIEAPTWDARLERHLHLRLPATIALDSVFDDEASTRRRARPRDEALVMWWNNEIEYRFVVSADTLVYSRDQRALHRLAQDSIVVGLSGRTGSLMALLSRSGADYEGRAYLSRGPDNLRQVSIPFNLRREACEAVAH